MSVDVSKYVTYVVSDAPGPLVSKFAAYAVVNAAGPLVSKATTYVVLQPSRQVRESKHATYVVVEPRDQTEVSKFAAYAVLLEPPVDPVDVSKFVTYVVSYPREEIQTSKFLSYAVLYREPSVLVALCCVDTLHSGDGVNARVPLIALDVLNTGNPDPNVLLPLILTDVLNGGTPQVRCPLIGIDILYLIKEFPVVVTPRFPRLNGGTPLGERSYLRGLGWSTHKKPEFNTGRSTSAAGHEITTAYMQYPRWEFNLTYDILRDEDAPETDLKTILGFFCQRQGSYDAFAFEDPSDFEAVDQAIATADGGTVQWPFLRTLGGFTEPVGQVNLDPLVTFGEAAVDPSANTVEIGDTSQYETGFGPVAFTTAGTLPDGLLTTRPYWVIVFSSTKIKLALSRADALAGTHVDILDDGTGTFTMSNSTAVYVEDTLIDLDDYQVIGNQLIFDVAPDDEDEITASFHYYFVCRFLEDMQDYEQFVENMWSLNECNFKSTFPVVVNP